MAEWTFLDFVDEAGTNAIAEWASALSAKARAKFHTRIEDMEVLKRGQWGKRARPLAGDQWPGVFEMRFEVGGVQYRPLFCFGPARGEVTILMGAEERGGTIEPRSAPQLCQERKTRIQEDRNHVTPHDFSA